MNRFKRIHFPPVGEADKHGLLAYSLEVDSHYLMSAYLSGIFPWPVEETHVLWFCPPRRALLKFSDLHVPSRLPRYLKKSGFRLRVDSDFEGVIKACASVRRRDDGTWITDKISDAYLDFHRAGFAHSFETLAADGSLVGGLYGVRINNYFSAESMFSLVDHASNFALLGAVSHLGGLGLEWMDIQVMSPHLKRFGARNVARKTFLRKLSEALS